MAAVVTSIAPVSGPPGTLITVTGTGFDPTAQVGCPSLVNTTAVNSTTLEASIPAGIAGAAGGSMIVVVFVQNADGSVSNMLQFTVLFPAVALQSWTTIDRVCAEIPMFQRNGNIADDTINGWIVSIAQSISSCMLRRGLPLDPALWQQPSASGASPSPAAVLEQINRNGAAARLAAAISGQFSGGSEWGLSKDLRAAFAAEFQRLENGQYDKLFLPSAVTVDAQQQVSTGSIGLPGGGWDGQAFRKGQIF